MRGMVYLVAAGLLAAVTVAAGLVPAQARAGCGGTASHGDVTCGPYADPGITMSNGYNTYDLTNCWAHPGCGYVLSSPAAGDAPRRGACGRANGPQHGGHVLP